MAITLPVEKRAASRLLKKSLSTLRQAQGERKNAMKSKRGSAHAELVEAWGGVFQRAARRPSSERRRPAGRAETHQLQSQDRPAHARRRHALELHPELREDSPARRERRVP